LSLDFRFIFAEQRDMFAEDILGTSLMLDLEQIGDTILQLAHPELTEQPTKVVWPFFGTLPEPLYIISSLFRTVFACS
jgi:hypothetical protein